MILVVVLLSAAWPVAMAKRIAMGGIGGERLLETFERLVRPAQFKERHAAPVQKLGVARRELQGLRRNRPRLP